jgi:hypothetical protein
VIAAWALARDYAVVQPALDGQPVGEPLDLYNYTLLASNLEGPAGGSWRSSRRCITFTLFTDTS